MFFCHGILKILQGMIIPHWHMWGIETDRDGTKRTWNMKLPPNFHFWGGRYTLDWMSILVELTFCYNGLGYNPYYAYTNELQLKITFLAKDQILMGQLFFPTII